MTDLRKAIKITEYKEQDDMIRDRIIIGIHNKHVQEKLLRESHLILKKAITISRTIEASGTQAKELKKESQINAIRLNNVKLINKVNRCKFCGYKHLKSRICPAYGKTCTTCRRKIILLRFVAV